MQNENNVILLAISLVQLGWLCGLAFVPCELSERLSIEFVKVCDAVDELNWYKFSIRMQKMIPIIMINTQEPVALRCFGSIFCGRSVFKQVRVLDKTQV